MKYNNIETLLNRLDGFKTIKASEDKMELKTPMGKLEVNFTTDVISGFTEEFSLQVILNISKNGCSIYRWGSMSNKDNAKIIKFFQEKYHKDFQKKHEDRKQNEKDICILLNL